MLGGELWWNPNLAIYGVDGTPIFPHELLGWDYGRMLENVWRLFQATHSKFEVGDGTRISFWHNLWVEDMTHKAAFQLCLV